MRNGGAAGRKCKRVIMDVLNNFNLQRKKAKYLVIKDHLLREFASGNYETGQLLPSENTLCRDLGVARNTVRQAIKELIQEGLVRRVRGKGSYFTGSLNRGGTAPLNIFSLVMPEINRGQYPVLTKGFDHKAGLLQNQIMVCNTDFDIHKQGNIILQMIEKNIAGVALVPALDPPTPAFHIRQLQRHGIPVVLCHRGVADASAPLITWESRSVGHLAGKTLIEYGHRHIGYFSMYRYELPLAHIAGLRDILEQQGLELPDDCICFGESLHDNPEDQQRKQQALWKMTTGKQRVTAIVCNDDHEAETLYYLATQLGIQIPESLSLIGFGDSHARTTALRSRLTSITIDEYDLGQQAAAILQEMRVGHRPIESNEVFYKPLQLTKGQTLKRISSD